MFFLAFVTVGYSQDTAQKLDTIVHPWDVLGKFSFLFNQSSFTNWVAGGTNTVAGNIAINYDFNYHKKKWSWDNKINSTYGISYNTDQGIRKTDDHLEYNSILGLKAKRYWFFSFISNFKTQYTRGYDYKKTPELSISNFLAPAYWSFGPGMLWKKSDEARINITPASGRLTFVTDEFSGKYGVDEGANINFSLGFNLSAYFKFFLMSDVLMENTLALYADYLDKPQNVDIDYQARFFIIVNEYLSTNLEFHIIFDDNASSRIQFKQVFGLGINYIFHKM